MCPSLVPCICPFAVHNSAAPFVVRVLFPFPCFFQCLVSELVRFPLRFRVFCPCRSFRRLLPISVFVSVSVSVFVFLFGGGAYLRREIPPVKKKVKKIPFVACRLKKMSYLCSRKRDEGACEPREIVPQTSLRDVSRSV